MFLILALLYPWMFTDDMLTSNISEFLSSFSNNVISYYRENKATEMNFRIKYVSLTWDNMDIKKKMNQIHIII